MITSSLRSGAALIPRQAGEILSAHNVYRSRVGSPPLAWSDKLARRAQEWANYLINENRFGLRRDGVFGENLYELVGSLSSSPSAVVAAWASEKLNYDEASNTCTGRCGHYTQIVWRATKQVGCGVARSRLREVWVCNYDPLGNFVGERPY